MQPEAAACLSALLLAAVGEPPQVADAFSNHQCEPMLLVWLKWLCRDTWLGVGDLTTQLVSCCRCGALAECCMLCWVGPRGLAGTAPRSSSG